MKKLLFIILIMLILPIKALAVTPMVDAGCMETVCLRADGTVWAWGDNYYGQLGDGTTTATNNPIQVKGPNGIGYLSDIIIAEVSSDFGHNMAALRSDGTVWTWGRNNYGQLGIGNKTNKSTPVQVNGLTGVKSISVGDSYVLALKNDGTVWSWGCNSFGQLGDGTSGLGTEKTSPVQVLGPEGVDFLTDIVAVSAGDESSAALKSDGTVWTWGRNTKGQLGNGNTTDSNRPVQVITLTDIIQVSIDGDIDGHGIALKEDGTVWSWGCDNHGRLGDGGANVNTSSPVQVKGLNGQGFLTDVKAIEAGWNGSIAIKNDGTVWAWGLNNYGQLGINNTNDKSTPVQVLGPNGIGHLSDIISISMGDMHTEVIRSDGTVWAFGYNYNGQLGINTGINVLVPSQVIFRNLISTIGLEAADKISSGGYHTVMLKDDGTVWTWGDNTYSQLGIGVTGGFKTSPMEVKGLTNIISISANWNHTVALKNDGTVWAWGQNTYGELGNGTTIDSNVPVQVSGLTDVVSISTGAFHNIVVKDDGTVWVWGNNNYGEFGNGTTNSSNVPIQIEGLSDIAAISAGGRFTVALKNDGTVYTWGRNNYGQLGIGSSGDANNKSTPTQVSGLTNVSKVFTGYYNTIVVKNDGTVWSWGRNDYGQLGNGTTTNSNVPVQVSNLIGVDDASFGFVHTITLKNDGTVWSFGYNSIGQLGDNTLTNRSTRVQVKGPYGVNTLTDVKEISAGYYHSIALKNDGSVWTWGKNNSGQLGDGTLNSSRTPVQVVEDAVVEIIPTFLQGSTDDLSSENVYGTYDDDRKNFRYFVGKDSNGNPKIMLVSKTGKSKDFSRDDILDAEGKFRWGIYYIGRKGTIGVYGPTN